MHHENMGTILEGASHVLGYARVVLGGFVWRFRVYDTVSLHFLRSSLSSLLVLRNQIVVRYHIV